MLKEIIETIIESKGASLEVLCDCLVQSQVYENIEDLFTAKGIEKVFRSLWNRFDLDKNLFADKVPGAENVTFNDIFKMDIKKAAAYIKAEHE